MDVGGERRRGALHRDLPAGLARLGVERDDDRAARLGVRLRRDRARRELRRDRLPGRAAEASAAAEKAAAASTRRRRGRHASCSHLVPDPGDRQTQRAPRTRDLRRRPPKRGYMPRSPVLRCARFVGAAGTGSFGRCGRARERTEVGGCRAAATRTDRRRLHAAGACSAPACSPSSLAVAVTAAATASSGVKAKPTTFTPVIVRANPAAEPRVEGSTRALGGTGADEARDRERLLGDVVSCRRHAGCCAKASPVGCAASVAVGSGRLQSRSTSPDRPASQDPGCRAA